MAISKRVFLSSRVRPGTFCQECRYDRVGFFLILNNGFFVLVGRHVYVQFQKLYSGHKGEKEVLKALYYILLTEDCAAFELFHYLFVFLDAGIS